MTIIRILLGLVHAILKIFVQVTLEAIAEAIKILSIAGLTALIAIGAAVLAGYIVNRRRNRS